MMVFYPYFYVNQKDEKPLLVFFFLSLFEEFKDRINKLSSELKTLATNLTKAEFSLNRDRHP